MLIEFRELGLSLVGNAERVGRQGEGLAPVAALLRGEEDGGNLAQSAQGFAVVVLHRRAVDEDQVGRRPIASRFGAPIEPRIGMSPARSAR